MIRLTMRDNPADSLDELLYHILNPTRAEQRAVGDAVRHGFADNFRQQRSAAGAWAPLARRTVAERIALGFPGPRPILRRTGSYRRSFTNRDHPLHSQQWSRSAGGWTLAVGSEDDRVEELEGGRHNMPPRPVTLLGGQSEARIGNVLDQILDRLAR